MNQVAGKVAIVTGAARGMGLAHARRLAEEGAKVAITDIDEDCGREAAKSAGAGALFYKHDVTNNQSWHHMVEDVAQNLGPVSVLINNAGIGYPVAIDKLDEAEYRRFFEINELGCFLGMKAVLGSMRRAGGGSIVNISSACGLLALEETVAYTATKFAVRGMTKAAALELGKDRIRVNSVHPALTRTEMCREETREMFAESVPLKRIAEVEEVANLILFLASDQSSYCTGAEFIIDGGFSAGR